jgi:DNA-binding NtrC family response regulator
VTHYVAAFAREFRKPVRGVTAEALERLQRHGWPGNIRELRNAVERAVLLAETDRLGPEHFPMLSVRPSTSGFELPPNGVKLDELERDLVAQALSRSGGNQTRAAALLGLNRDQIRYRIEKYALGRS